MARGRKAAKAMGGDYLLLRPEKASAVDLLRVLFSSWIGLQRPVESCRPRKGNLEYRFIIFLSLLVQKILLLMDRPMAWAGSLLDLWLNTLSANGGLFGLLRSLLWGKVVIPDSKSNTYASIVGNLDKRVLLDSNSIPGDGRYNGILAIMAAKLAYENRAFTERVVSTDWKMELVGIYDFWDDHFNAYSTRAFVMLNKHTDPETYIVSFRGTEPFNAYEWCTDFDISWYEIPGVGRAHAGFMEALGMQSTGWPKEIDEDNNQAHAAYYVLRKKLQELLEQNNKAKFVVTGHSLGGALAIMFPAILAIHKEAWLLERLEGVYTFGQPRVGDEQFGDFVTKQFKNYRVYYCRYVYCNDMVPRLPSDDSSLVYRHFGTCLYFNSIYQGKICQEPNKNYFSLLAQIPMLINAVWEIIRSYIIPFVVGPEYREGWFLRSYRLIGLLIPGLPDHSPQDYDNSARLGSFSFVVPEYQP